MAHQWSRQTYALGQDGASRLSQAAALIVGMCGVGAETGAPARHLRRRGGALRRRRRAAKNVVLSGFRLVAVHDDDATRPTDLAAQARGTARAVSRGGA